MMVIMRKVCKIIQYNKGVYIHYTYITCYCSKTTQSADNSITKFCCLIITKGIVPCGKMEENFSFSFYGFFFKKWLTFFHGTHVFFKKMADIVL